MKLEITGGEELDEIARRCEVGGEPSFLTDLIARYGETKIAPIVTRSFAAGVGPMGQTWKPLSCREGTPLSVSGALMKSGTPRAQGSTLNIESDLIYSKVQQNGKVIKPVRANALRFVCHGKVVYAQKVTIPARPFVPGSNEMPPSWDKALEQGAKEVFVQALGKGDSSNYV